MSSLRFRLLLTVLVAGCGGTTSTIASAANSEPAWMSAVRRVVANEHARTFEHLLGLTDAAGPRLAGSPGDALAVAWALRAMNDLGFVNVHSEPVIVAVWQRGEEHVSVVHPVPQTLAAAALGGSVGTAAEGLEASIVRVESLEELAGLARERVAGRIVFVDRAMARMRDGSGYGEAIAVRLHAASAAARLGAVAVLIRSIGTDSTRFAHTGVMRYGDDAPRIPAAAISNADADTLRRWTSTGTDIRIRIQLGCHEAGESQSANVIGEVRGSDLADQVIVLAAHLDSWDLGTGAIDDGAGVAIMLEVARQIASAELRPRRTVRVVLFANEENGSAGARAYADAHANELATHMLALEADFGDGRAYGFRTPVSPTLSPTWARVVRLLSPLEVSFNEAAPEGGADLGPMHERGVPMADVMQDGTRYFDIHHTANDVATQIDVASLDHAMRAVLTVVYAASLDPELGSRR